MLPSLVPPVGVQAQNNSLNNVIAAKPDAIIVHAGSVSALYPTLERACAAGRSSAPATSFASTRRPEQYRSLQMISCVRTALLFHPTERNSTWSIVAARSAPEIRHMSGKRKPSVVAEEHVGRGRWPRTWSKVIRSRQIIRACPESRSSQGSNPCGGVGLCKMSADGSPMRGVTALTASASQDPIALHTHRGQARASLEAVEVRGWKRLVAA